MFLNPFLGKDMKSAYQIVREKFDPLFLESCSDEELDEIVDRREAQAMRDGILNGDWEGVSRAEKEWFNRIMSKERINDTEKKKFTKLC